MPSTETPWENLAPAAAPQRRDGMLRDRAASVRQIVAYNVALARKERGLSQDELGDKLEQLTGKPWSGATVSAAESGWDSRVPKRRIRHFDVNEVAALALALRVPLAWFFLPPSETPDGDAVDGQDPWITVTTSRETQQPRPALSTALFQWLTLATRDEQDPDDLMGRRLRREGLAEADPQIASADLLVQIMERLDQLQRQVQDLKAGQ